MNKSRLQEIIKSYYHDIIIPDNAKIDSFTMNRDYFLDVFGIRYEISLDINKPIKGLKETIERFALSKTDKIRSTSIGGFNISITVYTDDSYEEIYGVVNFLSIPPDYYDISK